jgi:hypothetical protein
MATGLGNFKQNEPKTVVVVSLPKKRIDLLNTQIPAYAVTLPDEVADLLWQVHRQIKNERS